MESRTLARVNLNAVLHTLERLPVVDPEAAALCAGARQTIQFHAPRIAACRLVIGSGTIQWFPGAGPATISLLFPRALTVNKMFAGTGNPVPLKGFTKLGYLTGPFTRLTDRLTHFLKPAAADLADPSFRNANADLTFHLAVYALAEIGNSDPVGRASAMRIPDGDIQLAVRGGPELVLTARAGRLRVGTGRSPHRRATMIFSDLESAGQVLRGELASYTAIGRQQIELSGFVPMLDNMNKLLGLVPRYLS